MNKPQLFFSYAGTDRDAALRIVDGLRNVGDPALDIFQDVGGISLGEEWIAVLEEQLRHCSGYVILVGTGGIRRWVRGELFYALKRHYEQGLPILPLLLPGVDPEQLPPFLSTIQASLVQADLDAIDYQALARTIAARLDDSTPPQQRELATQSPFPGLAVLDDPQLFFGRQAETAWALSLLPGAREGRSTRWLQIDGASGAGKSSLVYSGVLPALRRGWAGDDENRRTESDWCIITMRPGHNPIDNLIGALRDAIGDGASVNVAERIREHKQAEDTLRFVLRDCVDRGRRIVLFIDQLEEIVTLTQSTEVQQRFDSLVAATLHDLDLPFYLITTIRSDFNLQMGELPQLVSLFNTDASRYYLPPISRAGLLDAIRSPAAQAGLEFSDDQLACDIADDALQHPASALPLTQIVLQDLWQEKSGRELSRDRYNTLGRVGGALAKRADQLFDRLKTESLDESAYDLLAGLVQFSDGDAEYTRRSLTGSEALKFAGATDEDDTQARRVIARLSGRRAHGDADDGVLRSDVRLITVDHANGTDDDSTIQRVDLVHETLLQKKKRETSATPQSYEAEDSAAARQYYWPELRRALEQRKTEYRSLQMFEHLASNAEGDVTEANIAPDSLLRQIERHRTKLSTSARKYFDDNQAFREQKQQEDADRLRDEQRKVRNQRFAIAAVGAVVVVLLTWMFTKTRASIDIDVVGPDGVEREHSLMVNGSEVGFLHRLWLRWAASPGDYEIKVSVPPGYVLKEVETSLSSAGQFYDKITDPCSQRGQDVAPLLPELVKVESGAFKQGSENGGDAETPTRNVNIKAFSIGKFEVTFDEYLAFVCAEGAESPSDSDWGYGRRPAIYVSWIDAVKYTAWLSDKTGNEYRLPTESEWEYVARAGTDTAYWWGDDVDSDKNRNKANCDGCGSEWDNEMTAPVGSFSANQFGIHDTAGNVWEWVQDCWHGDYTDAPTDGSASLEGQEGECEIRVVRGGSWIGGPFGVRSAIRGWLNAGVRDDSLGFRVARTN